MDWGFLGVLAVLISVASCQSIRYPCAPAVTPIAPTVVDGNVIQSLIDTIQLFIVSDLLEETLPEKPKVIVPPASPVYVEYEDDCDILPYEFVFDQECPDFVTAIVSKPVTKKVCVNVGCDCDCQDYKVPVSRKCVNFGLNEELILPPLAPELPCGLGYLPGGLPVVARAFAPCSKYCGCGCGCTPCSAAALPICSPYSCAALADPLCPDLSPFVKPVIL